MSKKGLRQKDLTAAYVKGNLDEDRLDSRQRFSRRSKTFQQQKTLRTALRRAAEAAEAMDPAVLPVGRVVQVHPVYVEVEHNGQVRLCVIRKTTQTISSTRVVVGDRVRFSPIGTGEGVIERIEPRTTILTRAAIRGGPGGEADPIVANAHQMLIVVSARLPRPKWGLVDRMVIAARSGGLQPIICLNKIDLLERPDSEGNSTPPAEDDIDPLAALGHYHRLGLAVLQTSVVSGVGIEPLAEVLRGKTTALAGHSGVGKSSLIRAVQPDLNIRVGQVSPYNEKGRHTTTSARLYDLAIGGSVVDTPGVKVFGLVNVTSQNLLDFFPDVAAGEAPAWRRRSYERILESLGC
ncbi:MAG: ribosome small subunit-dependent GTPase A [Phycisphaerae bacterium]|nr:ribosome small subunit-dependent GTPase A [Phycisphaerae bacterium]